MHGKGKENSIKDVDFVGYISEDFLLILPLPMDLLVLPQGERFQYNPIALVYSYLNAMHLYMLPVTQQPLL